MADPLGRAWLAPALCTSRRGFSIPKQPPGVEDRFRHIRHIRHIRRAGTRDELPAIPTLAEALGA